MSYYYGDHYENSDYDAQEYVQMPVTSTSTYQHPAQLSRYPNLSQPDHGEDDLSRSGSPVYYQSSNSSESWSNAHPSGSNAGDIQHYSAHQHAPQLIHRASYPAYVGRGADQVHQSDQQAWAAEWSHATNKPANSSTSSPSGSNYQYHPYPTPSYTVPASASPPLTATAAPVSIPPLSSPNGLVASAHYSNYARPPNNRTTSSNSVNSLYDGSYSSEQDGLSVDDNAPKPFIIKLYHMLANPDDYSDVISWDPPGTSFVVSHNERLIRDVLPTLFGHGNIASFTRQLNVYSFTRLSTAELRAMLGQQETADLSGWRHPLLVRGDEQALGKLKPRPSKARMAKKIEKANKVAQEEREANIAWQAYGQPSKGAGPMKVTSTTSYATSHPYSR